MTKQKERLKGDKAIGTTGKGIGPAYVDKVARVGHRVGELLDVEELSSKIVNYFSHTKPIFDAMGIDTPTREELLEELSHYRDILKPYITDTTKLIWSVIDEGRSVLLEGAQGTMLDIDHGTYPFVTSSTTISAGACLGLGLSPKDIGDVTGIAKAYCTRVGNGPFPSEDLGADGNRLREQGHEFGTTTGRPRRCGWFDVVALKHAVRINGVDRISLMKLDVLDGFEKIKVCIAYDIDGKRVDYVPYDLEGAKPIYKEFKGWKSTKGVREFKDLPQTAKDYIESLEEMVGCRIGIISTSPEREDTIIR